jgi:hypothetical protein
LNKPDEISILIRRVLFEKSPLRVKIDLSRAYDKNEKSQLWETWWYREYDGEIFYVKPMKMVTGFFQ